MSFVLYGGKALQLSLLLRMEMILRAKVVSCDSSGRPYSVPLLRLLLNQAGLLVLYLSG